jgi:hypothetical protein
VIKDQRKGELPIMSIELKTIYIIIGERKKVSLWIDYMYSK